MCNDAGAVPEQPPPLQPVKLEPSLGVAVRVTVAPEVKRCEHDPGHEIDASSLETAPDPVPAVMTVSNGIGAGANVAVTLWSESIVTVHVGVVPLGHPPPVQPVSRRAGGRGRGQDHPGARRLDARAARRTRDRPVGADTVPEPAPSDATVSVWPAPTSVSPI